MAQRLFEARTPLRVDGKLYRPGDRFYADINECRELVEASNIKIFG